MKKFADFVIGIPILGTLICLAYMVFFICWVNWGGRLYTRLTGRVWYPPK